MALNENDIRSNNMDKAAASQKMSTIYTTEKINKILKDKSRGLQTDMAPFFHGDPEWREAGIVFEYTEEEIEELQRCAEDPVYFIEKYCKFLNDKGRTLVKLRDYQKEFLHIVGDEVYNDDLEQYIPKNRQVVTMQSRQSAKCVLPCTEVKTTNGRIEIGSFMQSKGLIANIKKALYWIYKRL